MKQFRYLFIGALLTLIVATSCEKDPIPTVYDYRTAKAFKNIGSIPEHMRGDMQYLLFSIEDKAYIFGTANSNAYYNRALYEYNSIDNQWNIAWSVDEHFQPSENGNTQQEIEEYELQREIYYKLALALEQQTKFASCAFNGKGYYFIEDAVMEFDPQAHRWSLKSFYNRDFRTIVSTTQGFFQVGYDALSKYDTATNSWNIESHIPYYELCNATDIFTYQDQIYFQEEGLLGIYTPSNQQWEVIEHGIDFSSYRQWEDVYPMQVPNSPIKTNFVLNNKYYILYDQRYYEYDLTTRSTCVILLNESTYYINQLNHAFVANNKAFLIDTQNKQLIEFIP